MFYAYSRCVLDNICIVVAIGRGTDVLQLYGQFVSNYRWVHTPRDQQYYKQAGKRTLTLHTFFKIVWGSGWGVKKPFSELFAWVRVYRARRSELQISKNNTFFKIDWPASDIVDLQCTMCARIGR